MNTYIHQTSSVQGGVKQMLHTFGLHSSVSWDNVKQYKEDSLVGQPYLLQWAVARRILEEGRTVRFKEITAIAVLSKSGNPIHIDRQGIFLEDLGSYIASASLTSIVSSRIMLLRGRGGILPPYSGIRVHSRLFSVGVHVFLFFGSNWIPSRSVKRPCQSVVNKLCPAISGIHFLEIPLTGPLVFRLYEVRLNHWYADIFLTQETHFFFSRPNFWRSRFVWGLRSINNMLRDGLDGTPLLSSWFLLALFF